jgi:predicted RNase H-like nuclease (RuvC/YqgF family)
MRNRDQNQQMALQNAFAVIQEKNSTLEKNLSAETRIKLDLFSALGEARREIEIKDSEWREVMKIANLNLYFSYLSDYLCNKDKQLEDLERKTAQLLALLPVDTHFQMNLAMTASTSSHMEPPDSSLFAKNSQLNAG